MERTEKIKNKFKNVSNLKLYKKVNRARFGMNLCFLLAFFTLFFFLVFLISMIPENFVHLINIFKILMAIISVILVGKMDKLYKKIQLPSEIEQEYRINHVEEDKVIGYKNVNSPNGIIEFKVNNKIKKRLKYRNIISTFGGKVAVGFIIILILTTIFLPIYMLNNKENISDILQLNDKIVINGLIIGTFIFFLIFTIVAIICTFKQRIKLEDNRLIDILKTDGKYLIYQYKLGLKKYTIDGYYIELIDLSKTEAFYDKSNRNIFIQGEINELHISNKKQISNISNLEDFLQFVDFIKTKVKTDEKIGKRIKILNYFEPDLVNFLGLNK